MKVLRAAVALEMLGIALGVVVTAWFNRVTMLLFFAIGLPAVAFGILLYLVTVIRRLTRSGAL